jgi:hypothetical protein
MVSSMPKRVRGATFETVLKIAGEFPGIEEGISYGTRAIRVKGKFLARLKEDGQTLAIRIDMGWREFLMNEDPKTFYVTDHYAGYPAILIRLARVDPRDLREIIERGWRALAPKRMVATYDASKSASPASRKKTPATSSIK